MIKRPDDLIKCETFLIFNGIEYHCLEIDLAHINEGKEGKRKSSFSVAVIEGIVFDLINDLNKVPESFRNFENGFCEYFLITGQHKLRNYRIVFCICSDRPHAIGIITLFRI